MDVSTFCQLPFEAHGDVNAIQNATLHMVSYPDQPGRWNKGEALMTGKLSASKELPCSTMELTVLHIMDLARVL